LLIRRGDKIILQIQSGAVRVRATGIAMQDGKPGESIKLKYDNNILQGLVAKDGTIIMIPNKIIN
jgi:flagella basal body P-ring formation protein FlgA